MRIGSRHKIKKHRYAADDWIWWKHGTVYQIYPRSFKDSNNDGIGDLQGIISKIDYLAWLGVDAVWLSPVCPSPMKDFGYDISDYAGIDPVFGTLADFDKLIDAAHAEGIRIVFDLVLNHTSDQHPWFVQSRSSRTNTKRDWYIWKNGKNGNAPNNWQSSFGGSAWEYDAATDQYYLHSCLREQPDLNWRSKPLICAVENVMRFWLDRGVDGFRLDVANWFMKDDKFRDNPLRFFNKIFQRHVYDRNRPDNHELMRKIRTVIDQYDDRMAVGEIFTMPPGDPVLSAEYFGNDDELNLAFDFSLLYTPWDARKFYLAVSKWISAVKIHNGWPCFVLSNHDQWRSFTRFGTDNRNESVKRAKMISTFLLTLFGTPFLYYGEEIGMTNAVVSRNEIQDPLGKRFWPIYCGRDGARTPMQWDKSPNGGFSGARPWISINEDYTRVNVDAQINDPYSLLRHYRALLHLRRVHKALIEGELEFVSHGKNGVISFYRTCAEEKMFVACNFTDADTELSVHNRGQWRVIHSTHRTSRTHFSDLNITLNPYEAIVIKRIGDL